MIEGVGLFLCFFLMGDCLEGMQSRIKEDKDGKFWDYALRSAGINIAAFWFLYRIGTKT